MSFVTSVQISQRKPLHLILIAALLLAIAVAAFPAAASAQDDPGAVYVMTNQTGGNGITVYARGADGALALSGTVPTGGTGTGGDLGSQGALVLSDDGRWLFAVNAGSNDVSIFDVRPGGLVLTDREASGGAMPISLTFADGVLYVLNAGSSGNIAGFTLDNNGQLSSIPGSTRPLSNGGAGAAPGPAQVSFSPDGATLVVTEKASNLIVTYAVDKDGVAGSPAAHPSSGATPFGFEFAGRDMLVVSEAFGGAPGASAVSSYVLSGGGVQLASASVPTTQTAACWIAVAKNGKFAYAANAGSASISSYAVAQDGSISLLAAQAGVVAGMNANAVDMAFSHNGRFLYLLSSRNGTIAGFALAADGSLSPLGEFGGLPAGAVGVAAW